METNNAQVKLQWDYASIYLTNGVNLFSINEAQDVWREGQFMQENLLN